MRTSLLSTILVTAFTCSLLAPAYVLAEDTIPAVTAEVRSQRGMKGLTEDQLSQVRAAVSTRETALQAAASAFGSSLVSAFEKRGTAIEAAWALTDVSQRRQALKAAWDTFRKEHQTAKKTYRTAKKTAWDVYKDAVKSIKDMPAEDSRSENIQ